LFSLYLQLTKNKQGVALTGRNTTGPPRAAPGELRCTVECYRRQTTTDTSNRYQSDLFTLRVAGSVIIFRSDLNIARFSTRTEA